MKPYSKGIYVDRNINNVGNISSGLCVMASGTAIPLHTHTPEEIYIIVSGTGLMILGDREIQVKPSQSFFIPPGVSIARIESRLVGSFRSGTPI